MVIIFVITTHLKKIVYLITVINYRHEAAAVTATTDDEADNYGELSLSPDW